MHGGLRDPYGLGKVRLGRALGLEKLSKRHGAIIYDALSGRSSDSVRDPRHLTRKRNGLKGRAKRGNKNSMARKKLEKRWNGDWLRQARNAVLPKLTGPRLAELSGINQSVISDEENGKRWPSDDHLAAYATYLHLELNDLIQRRDAANQLPVGADYSSVNNVTDTELVKVINVAETVGAGFVEPHEMGIAGIEVSIVAGQYQNYRQFGFKVVGNSMEGARVFDGDYAICVDFWASNSSPPNGKLVVVERHRDQLVQRTLRRVTVTPTHFEFWSQPAKANDARAIRVPRSDLTGTTYPEPDGVTRLDIIGEVIWIGRQP